ncbi:pre-mRNA-splicing factor isoform X2 [Wolffia australiana]
MDSDLRVQPVDISDSKTSFRKPLNDTARRKYRCHSPDRGSDSSFSDGSPSPIREKGNSKARDESKQLDRTKSRDQREGNERGRTSIRSDRPGHFTDKNLESEKRSRDFKSDHRSHRSDHQRHGDRYPPSDRGLSGRKYDEKARRGDDKNMMHDRQRKPEFYERERSALNDVEIDDVDRRRKHASKDYVKHKDSRFDIAGDSYAKKPRAALCEKPLEEEGVRGSPGKPSASSSVQVDITQEDINAARAAAIKAAELVNKNLTGGGVLSAAQKKKLLWGNKKNESTEEKSGNRWDIPVFSDRERQEKFNKLMNLRSPWPSVGCEGGDEVNKPWSTRREGCESPSRQGEGATDGPGEAVHRWPPPPRRQDCGPRSVTCITSRLANFPCSGSIVLLSVYTFSPIRKWCFTLPSPGFHLWSFH